MFRHRLDCIAVACRRDYTHFVSIPVPGAAPVYTALRDSVMLDAAGLALSDRLVPMIACLGAT